MISLFVRMAKGVVPVRDTGAQSKVLSSPDKYGFIGRSYDKVREAVNFVASKRCRPREGF